MTDRITLIAQIGAGIASLEGSDNVALSQLLKAALSQIVEDSALAATIEKRKAKDRGRKKDPVADPSPTRAAALTDAAPDVEDVVQTILKDSTLPRRRADSSISTDSAESTESPSAPIADPAAHITRALGLEVQEQDQKQKLEIANAISPGSTPGIGASSEDDGEDAADPPLFEPDDVGKRAPPTLVAPRVDPSIPLPPSASPATVRAAVNYVLDRYAKWHPRRRPGEKERKLIARHLRTYSPRELCAAIDGNAEDDWSQRTGKHELTWILRDNGHIDNYRAKAEREEQSADAIASQAEQTGWA